VIVRACAALLVPLHAAARWPRPAPRVVRYRDGAWAVPALGLAGLRLGPRTRFTTLWVRLSLVAMERPLDIVLAVDQVDAEAWRVLQAALRSARGRASGDPAAASARGSANLR
jgi:hypothetical protein